MRSYLLMDPYAVTGVRFQELGDKNPESQLFLPINESDTILVDLLSKLVLIWDQSVYLDERNFKGCRRARNAAAKAPKSDSEPNGAFVQRRGSDA